MSTTILGEAELPPLTGSQLLDPWRIRLRLSLAGALTPRPPSPPTRSEQVLWGALEEQDIGWRREYTTGPYRLDFFLPLANLAVEVDGGSHFGAVAAERDAYRDQWHSCRGIRTLRVSDREVLGDLGAVLYLISRELELREFTQNADPEQPTGQPNEVVVLTEAAPVVEAEIVRLVAACVTVLPDFPRRRLFR